MNNPSLRILAVVSFIVLLFGGTSVYLALEYKAQKEKIEVLELELEAAKKQLEACE